MSTPITETVGFAQMGFGSIVTASSATPATDGYVGTYSGLPYHIHPTETPDAWAALETAIAAGAVTVQPYLPPTISLSQAQAAQLAAIAESYDIAASASITDSGGNTWNGGFDSAQKIYGAAQLAQAGGAANVTIFDASNTGHSLTIAQATQVAATVGAAYQAVFAKYQGLKVAIAAAKTVKAVQAITW